MQNFIKLNRRGKNALPANHENRMNEIRIIAVNCLFQSLRNLGKSGLFYRKELRRSNLIHHEYWKTF